VFKRRLLVLEFWPRWRYDQAHPGLSVVLRMERSGIISELDQAVMLLFYEVEVQRKPATVHAFASMNANMCALKLSQSTNQNISQIQRVYEQ